MEYNTIKIFNYKSQITESGSFAGYGSVFNIIDSSGDMILPGAFADCDYKTVKFLWQHQHDQPIGVISELYEDTRGLAVKGKILRNTQKGADAYTLVKEGATVGLSIGFEPLSWHYDPKSNIHLLRKLKLWEISLVTFPANENAKITELKPTPYHKSTQTKPRTLN
jgi:HK97 family phage prohead protease